MKMTLPYRAALSDTDRWHASCCASVADDRSVHSPPARRSGGPGVGARRRRRRLSHSWLGHDELGNRTKNAAPH